MDYFLTIDRGNTAIKAALWTSDGTIVSQCVGCDAMEVEAMVHSLVGENEHLSAIAYCTVVNSARDADLGVLEALSVPVLEVTSRMEMPLTVGYGTPDTLGADRLAAAVGAMHYAESAPVLVADLGTAVTYDYVDAGGRFVGGNIAPGISMRLKALNAFTAALPQIDPRGNAPVWGTTTEEALRSGTLRGVAAELAYFRHAAGAEARTVLSGGSAKILIDAGLIDFDYIFDPGLVLRGLYIILKHNGY